MRLVYSHPGKLQLSHLSHFPYYTFLIWEGCRILLSASYLLCRFPATSVHCVGTHISSLIVITSKVLFVEEVIKRSRSYYLETLALVEIRVRTELGVAVITFIRWRLQKAADVVFYTMESSCPGSQLEGGRDSTCRLRCPSWSRRTSYLQGILMLVIFMIHFHGVASERNETMVFDTARPWNKTLCKIDRGCLDFHDKNASSLFYYWPEEDPLFDHCCVFNDSIISEYRYGVGGPRLGYAPYFDLGLIDKCLPYWKCLNLYQTFYKTDIFWYRCERTDLEGLYSRRFWNGSVLKHGLLLSALPFLLSLEILVISFALYCLWRRRTVVRPRLQITKEATVVWFQAMHKTVLVVWVHLCLLAIIGNGLIEAVGHQNPYTSQSKSYYNYARLYLVLSVLVWISSFLQQVSYWIAVIEDICDKPILAEADSQSSQADNSQSSVFKKLEEKMGLSADWKWQPIAAQAGILYCLWGFLTYVDDHNSMAAGVFGVIVQAAAPWSGVTAVKTICDTLHFLGTRIYSNVKAGTKEMRRRENSWMWGSPVTDPQWWQSWRRGNGGRAVSLRHPQSEDPTTPLGHKSLRSRSARLGAI